MSAQFYVHRARDEVAAVWRRVHSLGYPVSLDERTDVQALAVAFLNCPIVGLPALSERVAFDYLAETFGVDTSGEMPNPSQLAGALLITRSGTHRWIFVDADEHPKRQRFTIAHELGHLVLEAEPELAQLKADGQALFEDATGSTTLLKFGRCPAASVAFGDDQVITRKRPRGASRFSPDELREIRANHFAAELLMPYEGLRRLIADVVGAQVVRTQAEVDHIVALVAERYDISIAAARLRVTKDLRIAPTGADGHSDLFA